ncbi:MAG: leucine-rich repeat domain-containing protein [Eubacterium sp.]|nr:leucine-rich repeat domain-containing protein [Eubacterium sp.]
MKLKKILAGATAAITALAFALITYADTVVIDPSDIIWEDAPNDGVKVTGYVGNETDFVIPEEIEGKPVTQVVLNYDKNVYKCKSITIPSNVTRIEEKNFDSDSIAEIKVVEENELFSAENGVLYDKDKTAIVSYPVGKTDTVYTMPDSVIDFDSVYVNLSNTFIKELNIGASFQCNSIMSSLFRCSGLEAINVSANNQTFSSEDGVLFSNDMKTLLIYPKKKNNTTYTIPDGVETISREAFGNNENLTSIVFSDSVTTIESSGFNACSNLTSVELPKSLSEIEDNIFSNCDSLKELSISSENEYFAVEDNVLFNKDKTMLYIYPAGLQNETYDIPNTVVKLASGAFTSSKLTKITLPENLSEIPWAAFFYSYNLTSINIPAQIKTIGESAFEECSSLSKVVLNQGLEDIDNKAFAETAITSIEIPEGVTHIGYYAFSYCRSLKSVTIPESVTFIGGIISDSMSEMEIFDGCPSDLIVNGVEGSYAESYCKKFGYNFNGTLQPIVDEETKITVIATSSAVDSGTELKVDIIENEDPEDKSVKFDITLVDENGNPVQPKEPVLVRIPVPEGMNPYSCRVYHTEIDEEGNKSYVSMKPGIITLDNITYLEFSTEHFSEYVVTEQILSEDKYTDDTNGVEISGVFPLGTEITIVKTEDDNSKAVYTITATDENGNAITLEEENAATVKIKLNESWDTDKGEITVKLGDTAIESAEINNGYLIP